MIIYLDPACAGRPIPQVRDRDATIPEGRRTGCPPSVLSCTAWGFSCLANCSASGELLPRLFNLTVHFSQRTGGVFSVTLSVTAIPQSRDCDARVFYAACCRMVFGLSSSESC